jgi:replicative DNA helicase
MIITPPASIESEQALLGGLFLGGDYDDVSFLTPDDFYRRDHNLIFSAVEQLVTKSKPYDVVTVGEYLEAKHLIDDAGGLSYLVGLQETANSYANMKAYADIVAKRSRLRKLIKAASEISENCFNTDGKSADEIIEQAEQKIFTLSHRTKEEGVKPAKDIVGRSLDSMDERSRAGGGLIGISTGFIDLDKPTLGLCKQDLIIIAGRPSMGKSALAFGIMFNAAIKHGLSVLGFSMEMPDEQLVNREISGLTRIPFEKIRRGNLDPQEWSKVTKASGEISASKVFIDDTPALSPVLLRSRARKHASKYGLDLVVIDYLQLMRCAAERKDLEIAEISGQMKAMAKELNVPVILLSQLNRGVENRPNKRPMMSDLRDGGSIEQDADVIAAVYRDEVYNNDSADKGTAEIILLKQRNGPICTVKLAFAGKYTKFDNNVETWGGI